MAINFTDSPSVNDTVTQGDHTWIWDGTTWNLTVASATAVAGSNTQVQYNSSGSLAGSANLTFNGTTLTANAFSGPLTGDVTGNVSGTAATVTGAAQSNITSVGTLTGLTVGGTAAINSDQDITDFTDDSTGNLTLYNSDGAVDDFTCLDFGGNGTDPAARIGMKYTSGGSELHFGVSNSYAAGITDDALVILPTGKVGIGTSAPAYDLDVDGYNIRLGGYTTMSRTASGAASIFGHNVHVHASNANQLISTNTGYYGQAIRMYYNEGIGFHCASSTVTAGNIFYDSSNTSTERMRIGNDGVVSIKVNGVNECMKVMLGSDLHDSTGDSDTEYGAVGFAAAGVFLDRNWMGQPGITVLNSNAAGSSEASQSTFRIHGSNQSWASYPSSSGSDFAVDLTIDGSNYNTSDERRKTNIEDITGALAMVNNMRGRTFNTVNSSLEVEDSKTLGGKKYGFVAQEVMDIVPNAVMKDDAAVPLENGWCRAYLLDYSSLTAVLVEAIKELTTRLETEATERQELTTRVAALEGS